jgi:hypothetical protein
VHAFPPLSAVDEAADVLSGGHLWIQEYVPGEPLRVQLRESGALAFGDADRVLEAVPLPLRAAVAHVRERFDRDALRAAVADPAAITLAGRAPCARGIDYDWERTPPFIGYEVRDGTRGEFLPPDAAAAAFERLGLAPANALAQEVRATDFDPGRYAFPDSAFRGGPVAGVVLRNKAGGRALLRNPDVRREERDPLSPEDLLDRYASPERLDRLAAALEASDRPVTVDALAERTVDAVGREAADRLPADPDPAVLRSAAAERASRFLAERRPER